jgi:hypothetical protein
MLIIHGSYHFRPKRVGFRNDYCLGCNKPRRSVAVRTLDVGHVFWIPILPVGLWKHWKCSECGRDPHAYGKTRRSFKWAGCACLIAISAIFWMAPVESDFAFSWGFRVIPLVLAALLLWHLLRTPAEPTLKERLAMIPPASDAVCPFCATPLLAESSGRWSCPGCGAVRY